MLSYILSKTVTKNMHCCLFSILVFTVDSVFSLEQVIPLINIVHYVRGTKRKKRESFEGFPKPCTCAFILFHAQYGLSLTCSKIEIKEWYCTSFSSSLITQNSLGCVFDSVQNMTVWFLCKDSMI